MIHGGTVGIPASEHGNGDGGARGGGDIFPPPPEQCFPVYHNSSDTGDMPGGRIAAGITGILLMVGSGRHWPQPK